MTDQQRRRRIVGTKVISRGDQIANVRGEIGVGEFAVAMAETGEIEVQDRHAGLCQRPGDLRRGEDILGAGKAVREQRIGAWRCVGAVEARRQGFTRMPRKRHFLGLHYTLLH